MASVRWCSLSLLFVIACCHGYTSVKNFNREPWMSRSNLWKPSLHRPQPDSVERKPVEQDQHETLTPHADQAKRIIDQYLKRFEAKLDVTRGSKEQAKSSDNSQETGQQSQSENVQNGEAAPQCGYMTCDLGKSDMINVHLVPHTHDDVGWLKTVDEYFYGARNNIQTAGVQFILDTVFQQLQDDPGKKFIYVEIAFFSRWWDQLHDSTKHLVKGLVNTGQLEFTLGGWCMNDEASTHYSSIIDQHTLGFRFLYQNFGECGRPRIGWQIDPFGHSREQASLFAQFGFDGLFFARIDYQDMDLRLKTKNMESVWMGSESLGDQSTLFTGVLYNGYGPPGGFCFDCDDTPIMDDPRLEDYNVDQRVNDFLNVVADQAKHYSTNHIMMTMGSDFQYQNARINFKNYDKLIKYVNLRQSNGSRVNVLYSTPACYVYALNKANLTYMSKSDDFFPYASADHSFWTGYFTSRPALKGYERTSNNFLQVCKQLDALSLLGPEHDSFLKIDSLRRAMGVLQHHDGVSGTEKQHVAFDYAKMVYKGMVACQDVVSDALDMLLPLSAGVTAMPIQFCPLANVSYCPVSENHNQFVVIVYNPIGHNISTWLRVPVRGQSYSVIDSSLNKVDNQLVPVSVMTVGLPDRADSDAESELVFHAMAPPLGFSTYFIKEAAPPAGQLRESRSWISQLNGEADINIKNDFLSLTFDGTTGLLKSLTNLERSLSIDITQSLMYYRGYVGNNNGGVNQTSGAYVFRPNGTAVPIATHVMASVVQGTEVQEVHQTFSDWSSQVYRLYKGSRHVEVEWTVGHIDIEDKIGKEVISRYVTSLASQSTFYTDANGREILKRVRDYRPTWTLNQTEPVSGNYYPINSRIYIQDMSKNAQLTILTDRSEGGGSIRDGEIEILIHRRLLNDDGYGVGEPLNEPGLDGKGLYARGKHYLHLDTIANSVELHRDMAQRLYLAPSIGYIPSALDPGSYSKQYRTTWSGLKRALPPNVHLLTLEQWHSGFFLLRLEHFYAKDEHPVLSKPASVMLKDLFEPFIIDKLDEVTLGANQFLSNATRLEWNVSNYGRTKSAMNSFVTPVDPATLTVVLQPMQIRTFLIIVRSTQ